jgi:hypothetical protein
VGVAAVRGQRLAERAQVVATDARQRQQSSQRRRQRGIAQAGRRQRNSADMAGRAAGVERADLVRQRRHAAGRAGATEGDQVRVEGAQRTAELVHAGVVPSVVPRAARDDTGEHLRRGGVGEQAQDQRQPFAPPPVTAVSDAAVNP